MNTVQPSEWSRTSSQTPPEILFSWSSQLKHEFLSPSFIRSGLLRIAVVKSDQDILFEWTPVQQTHSCEHSLPSKSKWCDRIKEVIESEKEDEKADLVVQHSLNLMDWTSLFAKQDVMLLKHMKIVSAYKYLHILWQILFSEDLINLRYLFFYLQRQL